MNRANFFASLAALAAIAVIITLLCVFRPISDAAAAPAWPGTAIDRYGLVGEYTEQVREAAAVPAIFFSET